MRVQADADLAKLEQRMLHAISTTPTEDLLEENEVSWGGPGCGVAAAH